MTKEAITQVKEVEAQAAKLRQDAAAEVKRRLAEAETQGQTLLTETEAEAEIDAKALVSEARQKADKLLTSEAEKATAEAEALIREAETRLDAAVDLIVKGVMSCGSK